MEKKFRSITPLLLLIALNLTGMCIVMYRSGFGPDLAILCIGMCVLSIAVYLLINLCALGDNYLYLIVAMLSTVGIIILARIDLANVDTKYGINNMKMFLIGVVMFFVTILAYRFMYRKLKKFGFLYFGVSVGLYAVTLIIAKITGSTTNGASNWLKIGGFSLQPSEFIKILFILTVAAILTYSPSEDTAAPKRYKSTMGVSLAKKTLVSRRVMAITVVTYVNALFLFMQREWGTAVLLFAIYLAYLFVYDKNRVFFLINTALIVVVVLVGMNYIDHIQERVIAWQNPYSDKSGIGYQVIQALVAIGEGGMGGVGIGNGSPYYIPVVESDSIFAAICEELGLAGGVGVLMLYFVLVYRGFKIALSTTNQFNKAVSLGISVMLGIQTFIIVGGVTKLIPLTGITLPFISHGGSSMISTFIAVGILQAISSAKGDISDEIE